MLFDAPSASVVRGERSRSIAAQALSLQSRVSNLLALGLMLAIGVAILSWYYLHMVNRSPRSRSSLPIGSTEKSAADVALPPLEKIMLPMPPDAYTADASAPGVLSMQVAAAPVVAALGAGGNPGLGNGQPQHLSALERRLSGAAFASTSPHASASSGVAGGASSDVSSNSTSHSDLYPTLLAADSRRVAEASVMPHQGMLLPKGAFVDCTLETAIDSSLPGLTTCVTATDTFGADGEVVLLGRGTKLVGETRGQVQQGASRVFVLWTEARTPEGVLVPLDSPGADELGRSGLPGEVDRHFWARFGAALLISTLDGGVQAAVQSTSRGSGAVIYSPSGPQDVASEVLKNTLSIPPTVIKRNGDRIQILVARDVDFSHVYELRHATRP